MNLTNDIDGVGTIMHSIPIPLFCAVLSASISAGVAFIVTRLTIRANRRQHIENLIAKVVDVSITYPRLEDDAFCASWDTADKTNEEVMRYDNYWRFRHYVGNIFNSKLNLAAKI